MGGISLNYITLAAAVINLLLGLLVLQDKPGEKLNRLFFIFTLILSLWAFANFAVLEIYTDILLFRTTYATGGLALVAALPWVLVFLKREPKGLMGLCIALLGGIVFFLPYWGDRIIASIDATTENLTFVSGPLFDIYGSLLLVILFYLLYLLATSYARSKTSDRTQIGYTLAGISVFAAVSFMFGVILPLFSLSPVVAFDAQSSLVWVGLTTYAIMRHRLFNVKLIATQAFVGMIVLTLLSRIFTARTTIDVVLESVILLAVIVVGFFLVRSVRGEVERREEVERLAKEKTETLRELEQKNKNLAALQKISEVVLNENDMKIMTQKILDELPKQLDACAGGLLSIVKNGHLVAYAISTNQFSGKIMSLIGGDLSKYSYPIKKGFNQIHDALIEKETKASELLSDFISPPIPKAMALTIQKLIGVQHIESFPLYAGREPFGVMTFVFTEGKGAIHDKNYSIAKAISDDMSLAIQRAQAFQKLKEANEYLAQLDKMKDEFISIASHELNTPLAAIEGYLSMVLEEGMGKIDPKAKEYLNRAFESSKRLADLILDLLNVSRIEQGRLKVKFTRTSMVDLANSVIHELQLKATTKKIYLKLDADQKKIPETYCDPDRIREVIVNLVGNAIKFTEKGGITIKIAHPDDHIRVEVIDTGRGIADEDLKKLFHKFSQVKREVDEHQGTGLGLYISKNFVEMHKGTISVDSNPGKGSTFAFEIPILKRVPKAVPGAILEQPIGAPQIESGKKGVPDIIKTSSVTSNSS